MTSLSDKVVWIFLLGLQVLAATFASGISAAAIAAQSPIQMVCDIARPAVFRIPVPSTGHPLVHHDGGVDVLIVLVGSQVKIEPDYEDRIENASVSNGYLTFGLKNVSKNDEGTYHCRESAQTGRIFSSQNLSCIALERTHVSASQPTTLGGTITLTCISTSSANLSEDWDQALSYSWSKDGVRLPQQEKREARLGPLTSDMQGNYTCCPSVGGGRCVALKKEDPFSLTLGDQKPEPGSVIGGIVGALALTAVVVAVAWFCWKKCRGKKPPEDFEMRAQRGPMVP